MGRCTRDDCRDSRRRIRDAASCSSIPSTASPRSKRSTRPPCCSGIRGPSSSPATAGGRPSWRPTRAWKSVPRRRLAGPGAFPYIGAMPAAATPLARMRNLGVVAHIDAGKTTVSERILFYTGVERRMGEVHEGTATMDYLEEERARGITITAAATTVPWREHAIHLIDTPGHVDFTVEVERCMRVLDGAVLVINGVAGVQAQSETVWRQMKRHGVRALAFVNQLDRPGADFLRCVGDLKKRLGLAAVPVQYPLVRGRETRAVVDLLTRACVEFPEAEQGKNPRTVPLPAEVADEVAVLRAELLDVLAEEDEEVMAAVLEEREPSLALLKRALRARVLAGTLVPVLGGAALRNIGVQPLLDAVVDYLPSPADVPPVRGVHALNGATLERRPDPAGPPCALGFK